VFSLLFGAPTLILLGIRLLRGETRLLSLIVGSARTVEAKPPWLNPAVALPRPARGCGPSSPASGLLRPEDKTEAPCTGSRRVLLFGTEY
jgi:hypothetical protein